MCVGVCVYTLLVYGIKMYVCRGMQGGWVRGAKRPEKLVYIKKNIIIVVFPL